MRLENRDYKELKSLLHSPAERNVAINKVKCNENDGDKVHDRVRHTEVEAPALAER